MKQQWQLIFLKLESASDNKLHRGKRDYSWIIERITLTFLKVSFAQS